jgi:hypothetical protein
LGSRDLSVHSFPPNLAATELFIAASNIHQKYMTGDSIFEVNLPDRICANVCQAPPPKAEKESCAYSQANHAGR